MRVDVQPDKRAYFVAQLEAGAHAGATRGVLYVRVRLATGPLPHAQGDTPLHPTGDRRVDRVGQRRGVPGELGIVLHGGNAATVHPQRIEPGPGQESVWDYPRPPRLERTSSVLRVEFAGATIAETTRGHRVLETSQPPAYYFPPDDVDMNHVVASTHRTFCEWKGQAHYYTIRVDRRAATDAAWSYSTPLDAFHEIAGHLAFYPQRVDACFVDGERVHSNDGAFYGGWITSKIVGPFKGGPGTAGW